MKKFIDLIQTMVLTKGIDDFSAPAMQQQEAAESFGPLLQATALEPWQENRARDKQDKVLVIGVASWSRPDMQLLDELNVWALPLRCSGVRVEIFNVYGLESIQEFEDRIPDLGTIYHTPVAGIWENGEWQRQASGHAARLLISGYVRQKTEESQERFLQPDSAGLSSALT